MCAKRLLHGLGEGDTGLCCVWLSRESWGTVHSPGRDNRYLPTSPLFLNIKEAGRPLLRNDLCLTIIEINYIIIMIYNGR